MKYYTIAAALGLVACGLHAQNNVVVTVDAGKTGAPITRLMFGGFMEPATTRVWAELLSDRKFFNEINSQPQPTAPAGGFGRRGPQPRWRPVGADEFVSRLEDGYDTQLGEHKLGLQLNVKNLFDKTYYSSSANQYYVSIGEPRQLQLSGTLDF